MRLFNVKIVGSVAATSVLIAIGSVGIKYLVGRPDSDASDFAVSVSHVGSAERVICLPDGGTGLDPRAVRSVSTYIALMQMGRNLVQYDRFGRLVGDLAISWSIQEDGRRIDLKIDPDAKWSSGQVLAAADVVASFEAIKRHGSSIHFDFSELVELTADSQSNTVSLRFRNPSWGVLHRLTHPEFATFKFENDRVNLEIASGAYVLDGLESDRFRLRPNQHFPWKDGTTRETWRFDLMASDQIASRLVQNLCDVALVTGDSDAEAKLISEGSTLGGTHEIHGGQIAFTFFFALNGQRLDPLARTVLSQALRRSVLDQNRGGIAPASDMKSGELSKSEARGLTQADALFYSDGPGRLGKKELGEIWSDLESQAKKTAPGFAQLSQRRLRILVSDRLPLRKEFQKAFERQIQDQLGQRAPEIEWDTYANQAEFAERSKMGEYDILQNNNDFGSVDLLENIQVAINPSRPLVFLGSDQKHFQDQFNLADRSVGELRERAIQDIGRDFLVKRYVVPAFHSLSFIYVKSDLDRSQWASLTPDLRLWLLKAKGR
jgi:ABC-type oligopeptide transport system substrate-binding subunit